MARSPLEKWRFSQLQRWKVHYLYHLTRVENLPSILRHGLLPLHELQRRGLVFQDISEITVQDRREAKRIRVNDRGARLSVHDMVPLFLRPKTPMLYRRREQTPNLCFILVQTSYITRDKVTCVVCDGNIASETTRTSYTFGRNGAFLAALPWDVLNSDRWDDKLDGKRKRAAEFLIAPEISPEGFWKIIFPSSDASKRAAELCQTLSTHVPFEVDSTRFF